MKNLLILLMVSFLSLGAFAQPGNGMTKKEQKEAQRIAFLTEKLALTPAEAEKFWPVYREYKKAQVDLRKNDKPKKPGGKVAEMTDEELEKLLDDMITFKQKELDLKKKYHEKFKTILPIKKVAKLYHAEEQFKKMKSRPSGPPNKPATPAEKPTK